jgi:hypothetical protein
VPDAQLPDGEQQDPLLRAVAEHWQEIQGLISQPQAEQLLVLLSAAAGPGSAAARVALGDELLELLPPGHPVIRVLRTRPLYSPGATLGERGRDPAADLSAERIVLSRHNAGTLPVTIYLADERAHTQIELAVEALLASAGLRVDARDDPVIGSWFRRMVATPADEAEVTSRLLQNVPAVLDALQRTGDAVIRVGPLLVVKTDGAVSVSQLTADQQTRLGPRLASSPAEITTALDLIAAEHHGESTGHHGEAAGHKTVLDLFVQEPILGQDSRFLRETGVSFGRPRVSPVAEDDLPPTEWLRPNLRQLRLTAVVLPFDLEEPPEGCRYIETTVQMKFDDTQVCSLRLSRPAANGDGEDHADDSLLDTRGVGRQQLTWKLTARNELAGLRPRGREVLAVLESPLALHRLTGTLDAHVRFTRRLLDHVRTSTAEPRQPLWFALNVADGTFETGPAAAGTADQ